MSYALSYVDYERNVFELKNKFDITLGPLSVSRTMWFRLSVTVMSAELARFHGFNIHTLSNPL